MTNTSGTYSKSTNQSGSNGQASVLAKNNAQVSAGQQGQGRTGGQQQSFGPFRQTLNNSSMGVENIPRKAGMFSQGFCPPPCPMPMCCPPPFCCPFPCPPPCMPRPPMCSFPCNPWCPPCFPPPLPCCPPPMPCCPPMCCPPTPMCCPPSITRKCCCISGNKRIVCIPRKNVMCGNGAPCDPCCDKPASYNNCNFYVTESPLTCNEPCPCPDPCAEQFGNAAAGDDKIFPGPRRDSGNDEFSRRNNMTRASQTPVEPKRQAIDDAPQELDVEENEAPPPPRSKNQHANNIERSNKNGRFDKSGRSGKGKGVSDNEGARTGIGVSDNEGARKGKGVSDNEGAGTSQYLGTPARTVTGGNSGTNVQAPSDDTGRAVLNGGNSGTTIRDTTTATNTTSRGGAGWTSDQDDGKDGNSKGGQSGVPDRPYLTQGSSLSPNPIYDDGKSRPDDDADTNVKVRPGHAPRSLSDPETTTKHRKRKKTKKKKRKRSKSVPDVSNPKKKKRYGPFRDTCIGGGAFERPLRTIYERECTNTCPWNDPCDYNYRAFDPCSHRDTPTVNSPCGLCYRDYDVCTATLGTLRWPPNFNVKDLSDDSRSQSPEVSFTWQRNKVSDRSQSSSYKGHWKRGPCGLPMPTPSDLSTYEDKVQFSSQNSSNRHRIKYSSSKSTNSIDTANTVNYKDKTPRPFHIHQLFDLNMNRSTDSNLKPQVISTVSLLNVSNRDMQRSLPPVRARNSRSLTALRRVSPTSIARSFPTTVTTDEDHISQNDSRRCPTEDGTEAMRAWLAGKTDITLLPVQYTVDEFNKKCWAPLDPHPKQQQVNVVELKPPKVYPSKEIVLQKFRFPRFISRLRKPKTPLKNKEKAKDSKQGSKINPMCSPPLKCEEDVSETEKKRSEKDLNNCIVEGSPKYRDMSIGPSRVSSRTVGINQQTEVDFDLCPVPSKTKSKIPVSKSSSTTCVNKVALTPKQSKSKQSLQEKCSKRNVRTPSKIPQRISRPALTRPPSAPSSAVSTSSVSSTSRPYSPGEVLGPTSDSTDPGSTVTLLPPKSKPIPKPRQNPPSKHSCVDPCAPLAPAYCSETIPVLPALRDASATCGTNAYRPHLNERSTHCWTAPRNCCQLDRGRQFGHLEISGRPGLDPYCPSGAQFKPTPSYGFQPDLTQSERSVIHSSSQPVSSCQYPNSQQASSDCPVVSYRSNPLFVQGHRIPHAIPSNNSVRTVLPKLPSPRNRPRTIMGPTAKPSQYFSKTTETADTRFPPIGTQGVVSAPRYFSSSPGRFGR